MLQKCPVVYGNSSRCSLRSDGGIGRGTQQIKDVGKTMNLIINHTSMQPVYEQIVCQVKDRIMHGELMEETMLPSVRTLAKDIKVSALTVKKAYDQLEAEGFVVTVHGKGSFVACANQAQMLEEKKKEVESEFEQTIRKARSCGMEDKEIQELFEIVLEDS